MRCPKSLLLAICATLVASNPVKNGWPTTANWATTRGWPHQSPPAQQTELSQTPPPEPASSRPSSVPAPTCQGYFEPTAPPYLNDLAQAAGKLYFGSATDQPGTGEDENILYQTILNNTHIFGQITPANYMKFCATEPEQGVFNFTGGQVAVDIAKDRGKYLRCYNLVWNSQLSDWVIDGTWTAETLTAVMENHIKTLITHFQDHCYAWDVINEALFCNGSFSPSIWYDTIGPKYFILAFQFAQEAVEATGKDIKRYYNDYGIGDTGNKTQAVYGLIKELQSREIRIDGIGPESHFIVGETPSREEQAAAKQGYVSLGVEVATTELDIRFEFANATNATGFAIQAQNYYDSVASCIDVDGCVGITVWDFDDQYSWIPLTFEGQGAATLYNGDFTRKPAYYAVGDALQSTPCSVRSA
ncbi:glycosyl hydrolase family 10 [Exophiala aquamarina CBS 119918]|uniref:Beta-xylanase n=1 Tax=Exophiala aquamarina CBS 119918 TaxID=1182545 RepID=A0A072PNC2_9EURO|nr:glycosyl hydrolase family 10 [Exophiala aquamarina CBS 119918]KEF60808.1 glycosyl hydrolase family 10 [Exophiala aquamarina CBS 119918]